jgi:eukaryotic-like serine/threonine-protein kinase
LTKLADRLQNALGQAYIIERELGGGGMSRVFIATETALGRRVVVKVLPPELGEGLSIDRFRREIQLAASLQHPHIVPLLAAGASGGLLYYTMPLVEGESLRARLARETELPVAEVIRVLRDVADALACAHERGVVHRDIKPDNVLLSRHHALVTDFGVAKALSNATDSSSITSTGFVLGTPTYMAPEQAAADPHVDHRADIYALGALGYEMLAGRPPFTGNTPQAVMAAQITQTPDPLGRWRPNAPPGLAALLMRCLEKRPSDRWQKAEDVLRQLEAQAPDGSTAAMSAVQPTLPTAIPSVRRHPVLALSAYLVACLVVLAVVRALVFQIGLPDWVLPAAAVLLVVGLPIILATATTHWRGTTHQWFNWPKALAGGAAAFTGLGVLTALYMITRALGIGPVGSLVAAGTLRERERIVVADFTNHTGDASLGEALTQAFRIDFAQSALVSSVPPQLIQRVLRRMGRPDTVTIDLPLAREVAIREGIKAVVAGDIRPAGRQFVVSANLLTAEDGNVLAAFRETARDSSQVIAAVDKLSKRLRARIGESLKIIRQNPPLEQVTTASLDALRKYSQGNEAAERADGRAIPLLEEAVALDSGFAMAYRKIGVILGNMGQHRSRQIEAFTQAFKYRNRLTDRERYLADAAYYTYVLGDRGKTRDAYRNLLDTYPDDYVALNNLGLEYQWSREWEPAARLYHQAIAADSSSNTAYTNLVDVYLALGRPDSANLILAKARRRLPGNPVILWTSATTAAGQGQFDTAVRLLRAMDTAQFGPAWKFTVHWNLGQLAARQGRLVEADREWANAVQLGHREGLRDWVINLSTARGLMLARMQNNTRAGVRLVEDIARKVAIDSLSPSDRHHLDFAVFYASVGNPARARSLLEEYTRVTPAEGASPEAPFFHVAKGHLALAERNASEAIAEFRAGDDGFCQLCAVPGLAQAYDLAEESDSTIAVYERYRAYMSTERINWDWYVMPTLEIRLGELYEAKGDRDRAAEHYGNFVALWNDADPVLQPRVAEIKRRLASLTAEPRR